MPVSNIDLDGLKSTLDRLADVEKVPDFVEPSLAMVTLGQVLAKAVSSRTKAKDLPQMAELIEKMRAEILTLDKRIEELGQTTSAGKDALEAKRRQVRDLTDRIRLNQLLPQIEAETKSQAKSKRLNSLADGISNGVLRLSTALSKQVSTQVVNSRFVDLFEEECELLRAPDVSLEFVGRAGQAERKKVVASYRPSQVLSEGEQKVLAIADFLAECRLRGVKAPIVFDDPVSSLDYRRLDEVADRVTALSKSHQVIVFTHNISFAIALLERRNGKKERCAFYEVRDDGPKKGVLGADIEPQLDSPEIIGKKINEALDRAEQTDELALEDALVLKAAALMRSWLETFVEQDLFANITQRYRSNVRLGSLRQVRVDRLEAAFDVVDRGFAITSGVIEGHSHADEQKNTRKTRQEIADLWDEMQSAKKAYKAK